MAPKHSPHADPTVNLFFVEQRQQFFLGSEVGVFIFVADYYILWHLHGSYILVCVTLPLVILLLTGTRTSLRAHRREFLQMACIPETTLRVVPICDATLCLHMLYPLHVRHILVVICVENPGAPSQHCTASHPHCQRHIMPTLIVARARTQLVCKHHHLSYIPESLCCGGAKACARASTHS
jgi:hypothetical protein